MYGCTGWGGEGGELQEVGWPATYIDEVNVQDDD